jgi:hypothetical protein
MTFVPPTSSYIRASEDQAKKMATDDAPSEIPKLSVSHEGEHHNDFGGDIQITRSTYLFALCAALNSVNLGYDIGTSTSAGSFFKFVWLVFWCDDSSHKLFFFSTGKLVQQDLALTMSQREIFVGSLNLWASKLLSKPPRNLLLRSHSLIVFGALGSNFVTDRYGRRRSFVVAAILFIIGSIIQTTTGSYGLLMFGRVFVGLGVGFGLALDVSVLNSFSCLQSKPFSCDWSTLAYLYCRNYSSKTPW